MLLGIMNDVKFASLCPGGAATSIGLEQQDILISFMILVVYADFLSRKKYRILRPGGAATSDVFEQRDIHISFLKLVISFLENFLHVLHRYSAIYLNTQNN